MYTYSSGLELGSARFLERGSYFVYIVFVLTFIEVSIWNEHRTSISARPVSRS